MLQGIDVYLVVCDGLFDVIQCIQVLWVGLCCCCSYDFFDYLLEFCVCLCVFVLECGIEIDFVCSLISKCEFVVFDGVLFSWLWFVCIQVFGGFVVWCNGELLVVEGKVQCKLLVLLQVLVVLGVFNEGSVVDVVWLVELLWFDLDVVLFKFLFEMMLLWLCKWLGVEQVLRLSNGWLLLNVCLVWCDVDVFECICVLLQYMLCLYVDVSVLFEQLWQMNEFYCGWLFGNVVLEFWFVQVCECYVLCFICFVCDVGMYLEILQFWNEVLSFYEVSLEQDLLVELLYLVLV